MNGSTFKRCACADETGKQLGARCPKLRGARHGSWYYQLRVPGQQHPVKKGGFVTQAAAAAALGDLKARLSMGLEIKSRTVAEWLTSGWPPSGAYARTPPARTPATSSST